MKLRLLLCVAVFLLTFSFSFAKENSCIDISADLQKGNSGSEVSALQTFLIDGGYLAKGSVTGTFGSATETAVKSFQSRSGIVPALGQVEFSTRAKLKSITCGSVLGASISAAGETIDIYTAYLDGIKLTSTNNLTEGVAMEKCRANAKNNPTGIFKCMWGDKVIFTRGISDNNTSSSPKKTYAAYLDGTKLTSTDNVTEAVAMEKCKANASYNSSGSFRCTWGDDEIYSRASTSTGLPLSVKFEIATLALTYDSSNKESALTGKQKMIVTAGSKDVLVETARIELQRTSEDMVDARYGFIPDDKSRTFAMVSGAKKEVVSDENGKDIVAWRIKKGESATFNVELNTKPKDMFPGVYTAGIGYVTVVADGKQYYSRGATGDFKFSPTSSNGLAIVGERSADDFPNACSKKIIIGGNSYTVSPCSISEVMTDGAGNKKFTLTIVPSNSRASYGFSIPGSVIGFPDSSVYHKTSTGAAQGKFSEDFYFNDAVLSANGSSPKNYSGYQRIELDKRDSSGGSEFFNVGIDVKVNPAATSTAVNGYSFAVNLGVGSQGIDVIALQNLLIAKGYMKLPPGASVGYYGPNTQTAVAKLQTVAGIVPADGYFGRSTILYVNSTVIPMLVTTPTPDIEVTLDGTPRYDTEYGRDSLKKDYVSFEINFNVTAGERDIYLRDDKTIYGPRNGGMSFSEALTYSVLNPYILTIDSVELSSIAPSGKNNTQIVRAGTTQRFTLYVNFSDDGRQDLPDILQSVTMTGLRWGFDDEENLDFLYTYLPGFKTQEVAI